eukprot:jgi/Mesvir1/5520/Mv15560-RA.2
MVVSPAQGSLPSGGPAVTLCPATNSCASSTAVPPGEEMAWVPTSAACSTQHLAPAFTPTHVQVDFTRLVELRVGQLSDRLEKIILGAQPSLVQQEPDMFRSTLGNVIGVAQPAQLRVGDCCGMLDAFMGVVEKHAVKLGETADVYTGVDEKSRIEPQTKVAQLSDRLDKFVAQTGKKEKCIEQAYLEQAFAEISTRRDRYLRLKSGREVSTEETCEPLGRVLRSQQQPNKQGDETLQGCSSKAEGEAAEALAEFWKAQASRSSKASQAMAEELRRCKGRMGELERQLEGARASLKNMSQGSDEAGKTPLHLAAERGDSATVGRLIEAGADINARDKNGWTPLIWAADKSNCDIVQLLMESGADPNARNSVGCTGQAFGFS